MPLFIPVYLADSGITFEDAALGVNSYEGRSNGSDLGWTTSAGNTGLVADTPLGQAFLINSANPVRLFSERIDVTGRSGLVASCDFRSFDSSSGFEDNDSFHLFLQGSFDGLNFINVADIVPRLVGEDPNGLDLYMSESQYFNFSTALGDIPSDLTSVRFALQASASSSSESLFIDNLRIGGPRQQRLAISEFSAASETGVELTVSNLIPNSVYTLESTSNLEAVDWDFESSQTVLSETATFSVAGPFEQSRLFYRVVEGAGD